MNESSARGGPGRADNRLVIFSHGRDSSPGARKIQALAPLAEERGWTVEAPDYTGTKDPDERVALLLESLSRRPAPAREIVLVGSSMGAYVSIVASERVKPAGLFLMAPAVYGKGYRVKNPVPHGGTILVVHGWEDEVIPAKRAIEFCRRNDVDLCMIKGDHGLGTRIAFLQQVFGTFLDGLNFSGEPGG